MSYNWSYPMCNGWGLSVLLLALRYGDISLAHSVEYWILNLEAPGSIPTWVELVISTFPLFPVTYANKKQRDQREKVQVYEEQIRTSNISFADLDQKTFKINILHKK